MINKPRFVRSINSLMLPRGFEVRFPPVRVLDEGEREEGSERERRVASLIYDDCGAYADSIRRARPMAHD